MSYPMFEQALDGWLLYVLVLLRVGSLAVFAPFFGAELFFGRARLLLATGLSLMMWPVAAATAELPPQATEFDLVLLAARETALGLVVGFLSSFVFLGAQMAGELVGQAIGLSMANVVDPTTGMEVPLIGFLQMNLATLVFIVGRLHLLVLYLVYKSYELIPVGTLAPQRMVYPLMEAGIGQMTYLFDVAIQLGMPVIMIMLMTNVVEGFAARTMPQLNIMVLGMPLRMLFGMIVLLFSVPASIFILLDPGWEFSLGLPGGAFGTMLGDLADTLVAFTRDLEGE